MLYSSEQKVTVRLLLFAVLSLPENSISLFSVQFTLNEFDTMGLFVHSSFGDFTLRQFNTSGV